MCVCTSVHQKKLTVFCLISPLKGLPFFFVIANYKDLKEKSLVLKKLMTNSSKSDTFFNSEFRSARGTYYAEYGGCYFVTPHYGPEYPGIQTAVLGHSLVHLLICLHHSLICSALLPSVTCSITHSLACGKVNDKMAFLSVFFAVLDHSGMA